MIILGVAIISCKKKSHLEPDPEVIIPGAVKTSHGEVVATAATSKIIGSSGGTLAIPNSQLKLIIPQGAVDKDINFSVQEVKTTCLAEVFQVLPIVFCQKMYSSKKMFRL